MNVSAGQSLVSRLVRRTLAGQLKMAAMLFLPAGSLKYWPGWAYLVMGLLSELRFYFYFYKRNPQILERRLLKREKFSEQKFIQTLWKVRRFVLYSGWRRLPVRLVAPAALMPSAAPSASTTPAAR